MALILAEKKVKLKEAKKSTSEETEDTLTLTEANLLFGNKSILTCIKKLIAEYWKKIQIIDLIFNLGVLCKCYTRKILQKSYRNSQPKIY
jgi:hypothetical protein